MLLTIENWWQMMRYSWEFYFVRLNVLLSFGMYYKLYLQNDGGRVCLCLLGWDLGISVHQLDLHFSIEYSKPRMYIFIIKALIKLKMKFKLKYFILFIFSCNFFVVHRGYSRRRPRKHEPFMRVEIQGKYEEWKNSEAKKKKKKKSGNTVSITELWREFLIQIFLKNCNVPCGQKK